MLRKSINIFIIKRFIATFSNFSNITQVKYITIQYSKPTLDPHSTARTGSVAYPSTIKSAESLLLLECIDLISIFHSCPIRLPFFSPTHPSSQPRFRIVFVAYIEHNYTGLIVPWNRGSIYK